MIKDGFLMLLIPSIKKTSIHPLQIFVKQSKKKLNGNSNSNSNSNTDPFVGLDGLLFDIRIRVETLGLSNDNNDTIINSRNISVDNTNTSSSHILNMSEILPSLVSKTSSIFSGLFSKKNNDTISDKNDDITINNNKRDDNNNNDNDNDNNNDNNNDNININNNNNNNNNDTSRSSSTDLTISPAERVKQRLAELRSNSKK